MNRAGRVTQISNLLYRRFPIGRATNVLVAAIVRALRRLEALRYSRLEICATRSKERESWGCRRWVYVTVHKISLLPRRLQFEEGRVNTPQHFHHDGDLLFFGDLVHQRLERIDIIDRLAIHFHDQIVA